MATVGFSEASKIVGFSRQHLYKMAERGEISILKELVAGRTGESAKDYRQTIDVAELQRVFGQLSPENRKDRGQITSGDTTNDSNYKVLEAELSSVKQRLRERDDLLQLAQAREDWLKTQIEETQNVVKLLGHSTTPETPVGTVPVEMYEKTVSNARRLIKKQNDELEHIKNRGFFARLFNK